MIKKTPVPLSKKKKTPVPFDLIREFYMNLLCSSNLSRSKRKKAKIKTRVLKSSDNLDFKKNPNKNPVKFE